MRNAGKTDVLFISNNLSSRRLIYAALKETGIEVIGIESIASSQGLMDTVSLHRPRLILFDSLNQPTQSIDLFAEHLHTLTSLAPIVLLTGVFGQAVWPEPGMRFHLLPRPITLSEVVAKVKEILEGI